MLNNNSRKASRFFGIPEKLHEGPVRGWRAWKLTMVKGVKKLPEDLGVEIPPWQRQLIANDTPEKYWYLSSVSVRNRWEGPVMTTNPMPNGKLAPVALNNPAEFSEGGRGDYGVYFFKTSKLLWNKLITRYRSFEHNLGVIGEVEAFGEGTELVEHEYGYRAQQVIIRSLYTMSYLTEKAKQDLSERYGCDVEYIHDSPKFEGTPWLT